MEPGDKRKNFRGIFSEIEKHRSEFLFVHDIATYRNSDGGAISPTYKEFSEETVFFAKSKELSSVTSGSYRLEGHKKRYEFLKLLYRSMPIDLFGRGLRAVHFPTGFPGRLRGDIPGCFKDEGLFPYKYTFSAENCAERNYFTEKICDAILAECLCFYWGCPNISDFFDDRSFVQLDLNDFNESLRVVQAAIENDEWSKRLVYIRAMKAKILNEYQTIPTIEKILLSSGKRV